MMSPDDFLRLSKAGLTPEQIALVMEIMTREANAAAAKEEDRKAKARERWHRWNAKRETNVSKREQTLANDSREGVARGLDNLQTKIPTGDNESSLLETEFEREFWPPYPRKVGKRKALKAFIAARKRASLEEIMAGLRRYASERSGEDHKFTKHPEGWLNGDHWSDEPAPHPPPSQRTADPPHRMDRVNAILDEMQGKSHVPQHPGPAFDGSVERTDWGGPPNLVQLHAISSRGGS